MGKKLDYEDAVPQVSVVCAWYNRAGYIRDTVDSLLAQSFSNFEIVIVNDGSTDPKVREILDAYRDERVRIIHQENAGFVCAIRRAIEVSRAPYIAIQGAGDVSCPDRLLKQYEALKVGEELVGVGCWRRSVYRDAKGVELESVQGPTKTLVGFEDFLKGGNPHSHGEVMFKRAVYDKVGGYRRFFRYAQDRDLWLRMSEHGNFYMLREVLYERRVHDDGVAANVAKAVVQKQLSFFAKQCAVERRELGCDSVDMFGDQAGFFRNRDRKLARFFAEVALRYLQAQDIRSAAYFSDFSLKEKWTLRGIAVQLAIFLRVRSCFGSGLVLGMLEPRGSKHMLVLGPLFVKRDDI